MAVGDMNQVMQVFRITKHKIYGSLNVKKPLEMVSLV